MDSNAYATLARVARPFGPVTLAGGTVVHVRQLTLGELRKVEAAAELGGPDDERGIRYTVLLAAHALCTAEGKPYHEREIRPADLSAMEDIFTPEQLRQIGNAAAGSREHAKN